MGFGEVVPWEKCEGVMKQPEKKNASGAPLFKIVSTDIVIVSTDISRKALSQ